WESRAVVEPADATPLALPEIHPVDLNLPVAAVALPRFERPLQTGVREARLLTNAPWAPWLGDLAVEDATEGWRFPAPVATGRRGGRAGGAGGAGGAGHRAGPPPLPHRQTARRRPRGQTFVRKARFPSARQPPLENLFAGKQVRLPFEPYKYQLEGIAFLMPR